MKNFKKVLALVLVLASLLGLATMAGAATEYKDADKINADYTEATVSYTHLTLPTKVLV